MAQAPKKGRFKYNLETVLKVKKIFEKQEQEKFAAAQRKADEEKRKEEAMRRFENEKLDELRAKFESGQTISNFGEILLRRSHLDKVKKEVVKQVKVKKEAETQMEQQRKELERAMKERKVFEKDKDHKKDAWKKVMDKDESDFLDEIATQRHVRKDEKK